MNTNWYVRKDRSMEHGQKLGELKVWKIFLSILNQNMIKFDYIIQNLISQETFVQIILKESHTNFQKDQNMETLL